MRDAVLIIGGGLLQVPAVRIAQEMGYVTIVTDVSNEAPAMAMADEAVPLDIFDSEGHKRLVQELNARYHLCGVFTEGADVEVTVASAAAHLGLPGIPVEAALSTKNKIRMRGCFDRAKIPNPIWKEIHSLDEAIIAATEVGYPLMVKSADNCGSRGTTRVDREENLAQAIHWAQEHSSTGMVFLEECFQGPEQSVEILFDEKGHCHWLNIVDRPFTSEGPYAIELGHVNPTALDKQAKVALFCLAEQAASACGVQFGAFKADTIWTKAGPRILEVTARLSGGFDCQYTTPLASGRNFIRAALRLAVGLPLDSEDLRPQWDAYAAAWAVFPPPGLVEQIDGVQDACRVPGVKEVFLRVGIGDVIQPYTTCVARPAFVIAVGETYAHAIQNAQAGAATLQIQTNPHGQGNHNL
jgi:biotin carboxylase